MLLLFLSIIGLNSCSKEEGEGGRASISGSVYVRDYNASYTQLLSEYYGPEEMVYITYGDNEFYDDRVRTDPDGKFQFKYLRKGNYTIFVYTEDTTFTIASGVEALNQSAEITGKDEEVVLPDFEEIR